MITLVTEWRNKFEISETLSFLFKQHIVGHSHVFVGGNHEFSFGHIRFVVYVRYSCDDTE